MKKAGKRASTDRRKPQRSRVITEFPPDLLSAADQAARERNSSRSDLIREAVREFLAQLRRARFEAELGEGYRKNAELDRRLCDEFRYVDAEGSDA